MFGRLCTVLGTCLATAAISTIAAGCAMHQPVPVAPALPSSLRQVHAGTGVQKPTVPYFKKLLSYGGKTYTLKIVGADPSLGTTTIVNEQIIPVALTFSDGTTLDGTNEVSTLLASPVFVDATYPSGVTQFSDGLMRAEFWNDAASTNYHVLLAAPTIEPTVQVTVPAEDGSVVAGQGRVAYQWFVRTIEPQILQQLNVDPTALSIFLTDKTLVLEPNGFCCYGGYHSSFDLSSPMGPATFTTAWSSVGPGTVVGMAHEITEWMNDPFYSNLVPKWITPISTKCGGSKLEVGDPEAGVIYHINGYRVSDMTFYSWFAQDSPSIGINGQYDMRGDLTAPAVLCP